MELDLKIEEVEFKLEQVKKFWLETPQCSVVISEDDKVAFKLEGWLDALEWIIKMGKKGD